MSRTKRVERFTSPVEFKLEWVGHEEGGYFKVWDRENKKEIKVELPLRFAYLDCTKAVGGFIESVGRSPYSNEVRYTNSQPFDVRYSKNGKQIPLAKGLWADIKNDIGKGSKFVNVIYAVLLSDIDVIPFGAVVKIPFMGSCNSQWIDLGLEDGESFAVTEFEDRKKGRTNYRAPILERIELTDNEGELADEADDVLQKYLNSTIGKDVEEHEEDTSEEDAYEEAEEEEDAPF